ncbi:DUF1365 domain-containing protein [Opitutaceae bacterium LMO-CP1]|nr:DUF1365 domain-containing protein [Opitutaceae bacterium LMO-M01]
MHARFLPRVHRFVYRLFMLSVDLDELPQLDRGLRLFSVNRGNLFSLRERDFLPLTEPAHNAAPTGECNHYGYTLADAPTLKERVLAYLEAHQVDPGVGARVELVTLPRMLGYRFNPVSFYYIRNAADEPVAAICEVTNTFHEMKPYLLSGDMLTSAGFRHRTPKFFYVSPFSDVDVAFDFKLRVPTDRLAVQIDDYTGADRTLTTTLAGPARAFTDGALALFLVKYPLLTLRVIFLIHWHAMRLWLKKVPWFAKAGRGADQRDLYRPHASLKREK